MTGFDILPVFSVMEINDSKLVPSCVYRTFRFITDRWEHGLQHAMKNVGQVRPPLL